MADLLENLPAFLQEHRSGFGQLHAALVPPEELHAHFLLQLADLLAQRWLGNAQLAGGSAEVQVLCYCGEIAQVPDFHSDLAPETKCYFLLLYNETYIGQDTFYPLILQITNPWNRLRPIQVAAQCLACSFSDFL